MLFRSASLNVIIYFFPFLSTRRELFLPFYKPVLVAAFLLAVSAAALGKAIPSANSSFFLRFVINTLLSGDRTNRV